MSDEEPSDEDNITANVAGKVDRRSVLKTVGSTALTAPVISNFATTAAADSHDPEHSASHDARVEYLGDLGQPQDYVAKVNTVVAERLDSVEIGDMVMHQFLGSSAVVLEGSEDGGDSWEKVEKLYSDEGVIEDFMIELVNNNSDTHSSLVTPDQGDERMIAAKQARGQEYDWKDGLVEGMKTAASELSSRANVFVAGYDIYNAFKNDGEEFGDGQHVDYTWDVSGDPPVEAGPSVRFYVEDDDPANGYDITVRSDFSVDKNWRGSKTDNADDTSYIGQRIYADFDVTTARTETVRVTDLDDPVLLEAALEEGVDEVRFLEYDDKQEKING